MSATKATFDRVREAVYFLQRQGEKPSASRVRELVGGGSQTTILGHMQALYAQIADQPRSSEMAEAFLTRTATKMVEEVWAEATRMASPEMNNRLQTLADLNDGLGESLQDLVVENEALTQRIESLEAELVAAEMRIADAIGELAGRNELEAHLSELSVLVNHLKRGLPLKAAMLQAIELVAEAPAGMDREELNRRMLSIGYPNRSARQARKNIVENEFVEERGVPPRLYLLDKGRARLEDAKEVEAKQTKPAA